MDSSPTFDKELIAITREEFGANHGNRWDCSDDGGQGGKHQGHKDKQGAHTAQMCLFSTEESPLLS
jgi:hypothetical protein